MALSVAALWTCIALEQAALRRAAMDARACAQAMRHLRERTVPVHEAAPFHRRTPQLS